MQDFEGTLERVLQRDVFARHGRCAECSLGADNIRDVNCAVFHAINGFCQFCLLSRKVFGQRDNKWQYLLALRVILDVIDPI